jgi:hypothetical protein
VSPNVWFGRVLIAVLCGWLVDTGCVFFHGQRYRSFTTPTPLGSGNVLVLGFMGGRDAWNKDNALQRLALKLRTLERVHVETLENTKRALAIELVRNSFDSNRDRLLDEQERASVQLILYGQSFGGAAIVKLARQLKAMQVPVLLTVQIDSVGRGDRVVPSNVAQAANLFQRNGLVIRGEEEIVAEDPLKTKILGNFEFDYKYKSVDISRVPWYKKIFRVAHNKIEHDPDVWAKVEELIIATVDDALPTQPKKGVSWPSGASQ